MLFTAVFTALYAVFCVFILNYVTDREELKIKLNILPLTIIIGLAIRIVLSYSYPGHSTDMNCFSAWADMLCKNGLSSFYTADAFTDYPPGYMYILKFLGHIINYFSPTVGMKLVILKAPAALCDIITGVLIYKIAIKNFEKNIAAVLGSMYILNPAAIVTGSAWGQVDSVYLAAAFSAIYMLENKSIIKAFLLFTLAVVIKPQALILSPVFIFFSIDYLFVDKSKRKVKRFILGAMLSLTLFGLMIMPFGIQEVIRQYISTLASYPYATLNAFNLWGLLGLNWFELNGVLTAIGYALIVVVCIASGIIFYKSDEKERYFKTAAFLVFATFMLSTKMHERYGFCSMAFLLGVYAYGKTRDEFCKFLVLTVLETVNIAWVLFVYEKNPSVYYRSIFINVMSAVNLAFFGYMLYSYLLGKSIDILKPPRINGCEKSEEKAKITLRDTLIMLLLTGIYSVIAFYNLGAFEAPESGYMLKNGKSIDMEFDKEYELSEIRLFLGNIPADEKNPLNVAFYDGEYEISGSCKFDECDVFEWFISELEVPKAKYVHITAEKDILINELAFVDNEGKIVEPVYVTDRALTDEREKIPERSSYYNSTYFDEIYHARTAYEYIHKDEVYEWTHPPLGKLFIALGVKLFGMTPFGWRVSGTVFGIFMIPFMFIFAKKITRHSWLAVVAGVLTAFDFMHFTQTRIATIDVYITFFVILMYSFMYSYYNMSFYDTKLSKTFIPLILSGVCFGLGCASKWTGVYAGAGLCVIFFITLHKRYREYLTAKKQESPENKRITAVFGKNCVLTLLFCVLAFVIIPLGIYLMSYIPFVKCEGGGISAIIKNQADMYIYHSKTVLDAIHPYSSKWYEWIIMKRPIWYYSATVEGNIKEGISAFGNPLVWWGGIGAMLYMIYLAVIKKDNNAVFVTTGYFAQLIPWMFVDRVIFIYHYFPCIPFLILAIIYSMYKLYQKNKVYKYSALLYTAAAVLLFVAFYPVLSGAAVDSGLVIKYLRWFSSWVLI